MKRIAKLLALALAAWMLLLPLAAAEEDAIEARTLKLSDPSVSMNGVALLDLEGVALEGTLAGEEGEMALLLVRLLGGEEVAAEGYAAFDGREVLLGAEGLSDLFAVPLERMLGPDGMEAFDMLADAFSQETHAGIDGAMAGAFAALAGEIVQTRVDLGVQTVEFSTGPMEAQGYSYTITEDMYNAFVETYMELLSQVPAFQGMMSAQAGTSVRPDRYNEEKGDAAAESQAIECDYWFVGEEKEPQAMRMEIVLPGEQTAYATAEYILQEDGSYAIEERMEIRLSQEESAVVYMEGVIAGSGLNFTFEDVASSAALYDFSDMMMDVTFTMDLGEEGYAEGAIALYPQGYAEDNSDRATLQFSMNMNADGENIFVVFDGYSWPADGVEYDYDEIYGMLQVGTADENAVIELLLHNQHADGHEYYAVQLDFSSGQTGAQRLYGAYEGDYTLNDFGDEDHSGLLSLGFVQSYGGSSATYELALNVDIAHVMLDAAELPALDGEAVDVRLIDEKTMERLNSDAQSMLMKATSVLLQNSPGLLELLGNADMY